MSDEDLLSLYNEKPQVDKSFLPGLGRGDRRRLELLIRKRKKKNDGTKRI